MELCRNSRDDLDSRFKQKCERAIPEVQNSDIDNRDTCLSMLEGWISGRRCFKCSVDVERKSDLKRAPRVVESRMGSRSESESPLIEEQAN